jgi:hypothetical protein
MLPIKSKNQRVLTAGKRYLEPDMKQHQALWSIATRSLPQPYRISQRETVHILWLGQTLSSAYMTHQSETTTNH